MRSWRSNRGLFIGICPRSSSPCGLSIQSFPGNAAPPTKSDGTVTIGVSSTPNSAAACSTVNEPGVHHKRLQ